VVTIKVFLNAIGWIGFAIIGVSLPLIYSCAGPNVGMIGMCLGFSSWIAALGVVLLLIGGFLSKWRYWWIVALIMGAAYVLASIPGLYANEAREAARCAEYQLEYKIDYYIWIMVLLPGLGCIIGGIIMRWLLMRQSA
jgi:glycerol uptake facilitator-like aquaporin